MPRLARIVIPGVPHHVTQRGNRRMKTFFGVRDFREYQDLLADACRRFNVEIWAYCWMTNHVHFVACPRDEQGLRKVCQEAHKSYSRYLNFRKSWRGHLWQARFSSFPMDETHLLRAARYIERNPVDAGIVSKPEDYAWSSARAHLNGTDDDVVKVQPLLERVEDWREMLATPLTGREIEALHRHERTGRPLGSKSFIRTLEKKTGRKIVPRRPGRKPLERLR
jgi:putative transposase